MAVRGEMDRECICIIYYQPLSKYVLMLSYTCTFIYYRGYFVVFRQ